MFPQAYFHYVRGIGRVPQAVRSTPARWTRSSPPAATALRGTVSVAGRLWGLA